MDKTNLQRTKKKILILCDFDGTISIKDTVNRLIRSHLTSPDWRFHVKRYMLGEIGSKAVYEAVAPLMSMTVEQLERFVLDHAALDPAFPAFLEWAGKQGIDVKIVSDGFDGTIHTLLRNNALSGIEIYANTIMMDAEGHVRMESPHSDPTCGICGTCKLKVLRQFRPYYEKIILIGDGESDRHAASEADEVLALKDLFMYCAAKGISAIRVESFAEIPRILDRRIAAVAFDMDGTLIDSIDTIIESFNHMFRQLGYPRMTKDQVLRTTSISLMDFVKSFLRPDEAEKGIKIFRDHYDGIFLNRTSMMPGAVDMLSTLDGTILKGIVTNKRGRYARILASHFGISDQMARIIGAEDGFKAKPSAEMFEEFIKSCGVKRAETVYIGDSPLDIEAAGNAGIDAFAVAGSTFSPVELALHKPRRVLPCIAHLPGALKPII